MRTLIRWMAAAAIAAAGVVAMAADAGPKAVANIGEIRKEVGIMAQVLEQSLDMAGMEGWRRMGIGATPLEPTVKTLYLPSVGVVFTIPVNFALSAPKEPREKPEPPRPGEQRDLWEQSVQTPGGPGAPPPAAGMQLAPLGPNQPPPGAQPGMAGQPSDAMMWERAMRMSMGGPGMGAAPYDEQRVAKLRDVLVGALAQYGHRMEHLPAAERVLVVVEAPGAPGRVFGGPQELQRSTETNQNGRREVRVQSRTEQRVAVEAGPARPQDVRVFSPMMGGAAGPGECRLMAVKKSDLKPSMEKKDLDSKIEEYQYQ